MDETIEYGERMFIKNDIDFNYCYVFGSFKDLKLYIQFIHKGNQLCIELIRHSSFLRNFDNIEVDDYSVNFVNEYLNGNIEVEGYE